MTIIPCFTPGVRARVPLIALEEIGAARVREREAGQTLAAYGFAVPPR